MNIKQYDFKREFSAYKKEYEAKAIEVLESGWYTLGKELSTFEKEWAEYVGARYCVGLASGLDALWISVKMLGIGAGDEVIVQANTYIASVMGITINGAVPVFIEPDEYYSIDAEKIEEKITDRTKAIMVVHLYGIPCDMDKITRICKAHNLYLLEDCAQSHGSTFKGKMTGTFGTIGCFSFFPCKTLGAFGDGGCIVTDDKEIADKIRVFRNYGSYERYHFKVVGANSRLDEIQAGLLRVKLSHLNHIIQMRQDIVDEYIKGINNSMFELPKARDNCKVSWHQFAIRCHRRDDLKKYLEERGIDTYIHYPVPPHLSEAYKNLGYKRGDFPITEIYSDTLLSLPLYIGMTKDESEYVIEKLNEFR